MRASRAIPVFLVTVAVCSCFLLPAAAAGASGFTLTLDDVVKSTTTLATLHQTVTVPAGTFVGSVNGDTGKLTGTLKLPNATTKIDIEGVGVATATIALVPTKAVTGSLNIATMTVKATATLRIEVRSLDPTLLPLNLVGSSCTTSTPAVITFSGVIQPSGDVTVSGTYTIPKFVDCRGTAIGLDLAVSGPGNTFHASMTPAS